MSRRLAILLVAAGLASSLPGCAWANRDNRPVWNAFEQQVVPRDDLWFVVSLPLSVPIGFLAILLDTFAVHPVMVLDDAYGDTRDLWRGMDWEQQYYTEAAALPLRTAVTPIWFATAFLARSTFDISPHRPPLTEEQRAEREAEQDARHAAQWLEWFAALGGGDHRSMPGAPVPTWTEQLENGFQEARRRATALGRAELYETARHAQLPPSQAAPWMGLADPDPVVRHLVLRSLPPATEVPDTLKLALRTDSSETVRLLALRRWP